MRIGTWVAIVLACVAMGCGSDDPDQESPKQREPDSGNEDPGDEPGKGDAGEDPGAAGSGPVKPDPVTGKYPDIRGKGCKVNSGYPSDDTCLPVPLKDEGIQIHIGPKDYADEAEVKKFILEPGDETSQCWTFHTPNDEPVTYQTYILSGRAGTHHIINTMYKSEKPDGGFGPCSDGGTGTNTDIIDNLPGASKPYMPRVRVAPENKHIGRTIPPRTTAQADMHYFNFTDKPLIREFWMNIYHANKEDITIGADQIRGMGGLRWNQMPIAPGTDMVYKYECPIKGNGRILALLGHYHAHGKRFTASIRRAGGNVEKVFEMFDYQEPAQFEYNTVVENPTFASNVAGAVSGILEVADGDTMLWECHIINDSDVGLTYRNEVRTGEMCNLWGASVGIEKLNCLRP